MWGGGGFGLDVKGYRGESLVEMLRLGSVSRLWVDAIRGWLGSGFSLFRV